MSTTTNVLLAIRADHRPSEPQAERCPRAFAMTRPHDPELRRTPGELGEFGMGNYMTLKPPIVGKNVNAHTTHTLGLSLVGARRRTVRGAGRRQERSATGSRERARRSGAQPRSLIPVTATSEAVALHESRHGAIRFRWPHCRTQHGRHEVRVHAGQWARTVSNRRHPPCEFDLNPLRPLPFRLGRGPGRGTDVRPYGCCTSLLYC